MSNRTATLALAAATLLLMGSAAMKTILQEMRSTGMDHPQVLVVERSPFTPEPLRP